MIGKKRSEETRAKMSNSKAGEKHPMFGKLHSEKTRAKISSSQKGKTGEKHPMFGKLRSEETRANISSSQKGRPRPEGAGKLSQKIQVIDIKNNLTTIYDSISLAALALNIDKSVISKYFINNQKKPYKGRYLFKKL